MARNAESQYFLGGCNFRKGKDLSFCRTGDSGPRGRRFESSRPDQHPLKKSSQKLMTTDSGGLISESDNFRLLQSIGWFLQHHVSRSTEDELWIRENYHSDYAFSDSCSYLSWHRFRRHDHSNSRSHALTS